MEDFIGKTMEFMNGDIRHLGDVFGATLSTRDELMLTKIDEELGRCVEGILDMVLAGASVQGEMNLSQGQRDRVMELTAIRRAIFALIKERGTLTKFRDGLN
jgi:hypothetical protein